MIHWAPAAIIPRTSKRQRGGRKGRSARTLGAVTISGPYTVERVLGRGATAVVELARDRSGHLVAVKRLALHGTAAEMQRARRRIRREAEVLAAVRHPAILPLLAVEDDGYDLLVITGYAAGGSLRDRVLGNGPLPPDEVGALAGPLLDALSTLHRHGVVHRDITPANILFTAGGQPVLADFDMATWRGYTAGLTGEGMAVGTPGFMAPEQARGHGATAASDVFGLAACLVFALTGTSPYGAGSPELLAWRASQGDIEAVPGHVSPALGAALTAMLSPAPERRPTAAAVRGGPTGTLPGAVPPTGPGQQRGRGGPRSPSRFRRVDRNGRGRRRVLTGIATVTIAAIGTVAVLAARSSAGGHAAATAAHPATTAAPPACTPLPYLPCGQRLPAPFTDGRVCIGGHDDYDGSRATGCEAAPDTVPAGAVLQSDRPIAANIVPASEVDAYRLFVRDGFQLLCNGSASVALTAPAGVADRVEVVRDGRVVATALSYEGRTAIAHIADPSCGSDDSGWYDVRVTSVAGRSAAPYRLVTAGHL